jgi:hypothetical protein
MVGFASHQSSETAESSNAPSVPDFQQIEQYRIPDFAVFMNFNDLAKNHDVVVSFWEVKPSPPGAHEWRAAPAFMPAEVPEAVVKASKRARVQVIAQALFIMDEYKSQDLVWGFAVIGLWFQAERFDRDDLPGLPEGSKRDRAWLDELNQYTPSLRTDLRPILNANGTDFSKSFKWWWTKTAGGNRFPEMGDDFRVTSYSVDIQRQVD